MKRAILAFIVFFSAINIHTQEFQFSVGLETGFGAFKVDNVFWNNTSEYTENINSTFFAPGISLSLRVFSLEDNISIGFFYHNRMILMTNIEQTGTVSTNNRPSLSVNSFTGIMDFDTGLSCRYLISGRLLLYADLGLNLTFMNSEHNETNRFSNVKTKETFNYLGFGMYGGLGLQVNLTNTLYLEFGLNGILNVFSAREGTRESIYIIKYEDVGRQDLYSGAAYIHIGWRLGLKRIATQNYQEDDWPASN